MSTGFDLDQDRHYVGPDLDPSQWRSQNAEKVTHINGRLQDQELRRELLLTGKNLLPEHAEGAN